MDRDDLSNIMARVALKDRAAFAVLYRNTSAKLFAILLRILRDRADAEDALQEVYVKIWRKADHIAGSGRHPLPWLCTIARYHAIDVVRSRQPIADGIDDHGAALADLSADPEAACVIKGEGRRIDRCMQELDSERAGAVRSAYVEGLTYQELAERHGVPLNTMRTWLRRSLLKLRECMDR